MAAQIGHYEIEERLATGGMSEIFRARHIHLGRPAAIKVLHAHYAETPQFRERFLQEARAAAGLVHPNIINIYDFGEEADQLYLVMELVSGGTVRSLLRDQPDGQPLPWSVAADLARQVAAGLAYAHEAGVIHRDIKPDNLLLQYPPDEPDTVLSPVVKITDFGLVRLLDPLVTTDDGSILGTPGYMSPEQCQGLDLDPRADIYALGAVLFELTTGRLPFQAESSAGVLFKQVHDPAPSPRRFVPGLPPRLEEIILRCLEKRPSDRFPDATSLAAALDELLIESQQETLGMPVTESDGNSIADSPASPADTVPDTPAASMATPSNGLALTLDPEEAPGRLGTRFTLRITNGSEAAATVRLAGQSEDDRIRLRLQPDAVVALPGAEASAVVSVAGNPRLSREPETVPFTVTATAAGRDASDVSGTFIHQPLVRNWIPVAAAGAALWLLFCVTGAVLLTRGFGVGIFGAADADEAAGILVTDGSDHILLADPAEGTLERWSGEDAGLESPAGLIADDDGNVYVADAEGDRVVKFAPEGDVLLTWGESGSEPGQFHDPVDVGIGPQGNIYVVDSGNHRIQMFDPNGAFIDWWGGQGDREGQFNHPSAIAFDEVGNFYIADTDNARIQKLTSFGQVIDSWGQPGSEPGQFSEPLGIAVDPDGNVYVTDSGNNRIQKFNFNGALLEVWDGSDAEGGFSHPHGIVAGSRDRLYIADQNNDRVQVFDLEGNHIATLTGSEGFDKPRGVTVP